MTKFITLLRHLKSSWEDPALEDFDRPLNLRGEAAGPLVRDALATRTPAPDLILCSTARRTRETLALVGEAFPESPRRFLDSLYRAKVADLLVQIAGLPETVGSVLVVGHDPSLKETVLHLAAAPFNSTQFEIRHRISRKYPTGGVALLALYLDRWSAISPGCGEMVRFFAPRDLF